jgi:hypothetical protein
MKIHRFYNKQPLGEENIKLESKNNKELLHQFFTVLKFKIDEEIILFNNDLNNLKNNFDYIYKIKNINKNICELELINTKENLSQLKEIKKEFKVQEPRNISAAVNVNNYEKFILNDVTALEVAKACPIHVRASAYHNYLLNNSKYKDKYPLLRSGEKVNYYFVKTKLANYQR